MCFFGLCIMHVCVVQLMSSVRAGVLTPVCLNMLLKFVAISRDYVHVNLQTCDRYML